MKLFKINFFFYHILTHWLKDILYISSKINCLYCAIIKALISPQLLQPKIPSQHALVKASTTGVIPHPPVGEPASCLGLIRWRSGLSNKIARDSEWWLLFRTKTSHLSKELSTPQTRCQTFTVMPTINKIFKASL